MQEDLTDDYLNWFRWWLDATRQQVITWTNVDMESLGHNELKEVDYALLNLQYLSMRFPRFTRKFKLFLNIQLHMITEVFIYKDRKYTLSNLDDVYMKAVVELQFIKNLTLANISYLWTF